MDKTETAKTDIVGLLSEIYGQKVGSFFLSTHGKEPIPVFVHNSYILLKQNMGAYKATEELDRILSKQGVSISSYD